MRPALGLILLAAMCACTTRDAGSRQPLREALSRLDLQRTTVPRLSIHTTYVDCAGRTPCGPQPLATERLSIVDSLAIRASSALTDRLDLDALHTTALLDLLWIDSSGTSLRRAISSLRTVARLSGDPAPALADLSAALLIRAERTGSTDDLLEAVDAAARSVRIDSSGLPQRFNLALALDRLPLPEQAAQAWEGYLAVDAQSPWSREARIAAARARRGIALSDSVGTADSITDAQLPLAVAMEPERVRQVGCEHVLGAWASAVLDGDSIRADFLLAHAATLGRALTTSGGDETLIDAVRTAQRDPRNTLIVARAYRAYSTGRRAFIRGDVRAARVALAQLDHDRRVQPLALWAATYLAAASIQMGNPQRALRDAHRVLLRVDSARYPALAGQIDWVSGVALLRMTRYAEGIRRLQSARSRFARAGEQENVGAVETHMGEASWYMTGDRTAAAQSYSRALTALQRYRHSVSLHNVLADLTDLASTGPTMAATKLQDEDVIVAAHSGSPAIRADAHTVRARLRRSIGDSAGAMGDIAATTALLDSVPRGALRTALQANLQMVRFHPDARALDSAVQFFHADSNPLLELQAVLDRAELRSALNDTTRSAADLTRALQLIDSQAAALDRAPQRSALLESARHVVDQLVALDARQPRKALETLERARGSLTGNATSVSLDTIGSAMPDGAVIVDIAAVADTVFVWTVRRGAIRLHRLSERVQPLRHIIDRVASTLELRANSQAVDDDLALLYDDVMRPLVGDFEPHDTSLTIIADGDFAAIPFAALRDRISARYLVEMYTLRFANSLSDVITKGSGASTSKPSSILVIADPAFDPHTHPALERLPGARVEADSISALYAAARILADTAANERSITRALRDTRIIHFAGHALVDDDDPSRSVLVLGSDLDVERIAQWDLHHVRLVVLSACETSIMRGRAGGLANLTGAFLHAGAHGVVGSLWRVDDRFGQPLMLELHRAFTASGNGPEALRAAQLSLLRSSNSALRSPAAWAGFRYIGS